MGVLKEELKKNPNKKHLKFLKGFTATSFARSLQISVRCLWYEFRGCRPISWEKNNYTSETAGRVLKIKEISVGTQRECSVYLSVFILCSSASCLQPHKKVVFS